MQNVFGAIWLKRLKQHLKKSTESTDKKTHTSQELLLIEIDHFAEQAEHTKNKLIFINYFFINKYNKYLYKDKVIDADIYTNTHYTHGHDTYTHTHNNIAI